MGRNMGLLFYHSLKALFFSDKCKCEKKNACCCGGQSPNLGRTTQQFVSDNAIFMNGDASSIGLTGKDEVFPILDSKHITPTLKKYDIKLVDCGDYCQVYLYQDTKTKKVSEKDTTELELRKAKLKKFEESSIELSEEDINKLFNGNYEMNSSEKSSNKLSGTIEERSIIRSKLECQRLAKANINDWKVFITLTFKENVTDVSYSNKRLSYFIDKVRRVKPDFKYLCIPEFQKRGATHYHMLCNVDIDDKTLIYSQENNPKFKHIKYWNDGFTSVEIIKGDPKKIVGYIAKYMTKDIDNRLFGHRRYFCSRNLKKPKENYINLEQEREKEFYQKKIQEMEVIYQSDYINSYDNTSVTFLELKKIQGNCSISK